jgi:hypothetical protein
MSVTLRWLLRWLASVSAGLAVAAASAQPTLQALDWSALRPAAQVEVNPFAGLPDHQFDDLAQLVRLDALLMAGQGDPVALAAQRQRIDQRLAEQAVATAELLAERLRMIERRRANAEATDPTLDGAVVQLNGYLVPAGVAVGPDGAAPAAMYFLVPELGACSHRPPPPPNQLVRISLDAQAASADPRRPVRVTGRLRVQPETRAVHLVDGFLSLKSGYAMSDAVFESLGPVSFAAPLTLH